MDWEKTGMIVTKDNDRLLIQAPAKLNLFLEVLGKRPDGFHELETLFVAVNLYDELEFRPRAEGTEVLCDDPKAGAVPDNLVTRAIALVRAESGRADGVSVKLTKRIPIEAGMAGGSSDAASTLAGLNEIWNLGWSRERLAELGARLGSDISFFFYTPAAVGRGRGEKLTQCQLGQKLHFVVVAPPAGLKTGAVFANLKLPATPQRIEPMLAALAAGDVDAIGRYMFNRLEEASLPLSPQVAELKRIASGWNCTAHQMSGSGSAYFALCIDAEQAKGLGGTLKSQGLGRIFVLDSSH